MFFFLYFEKERFEKLPATVFGFRIFLSSSSQSHISLTSLLSIIICFWKWHIKSEFKIVLNFVFPFVWYPVQHRESSSFWTMQFHSGFYCLFMKISSSSHSLSLPLFLSGDIFHLLFMFFLLFLFFCIWFSKGEKVYKKDSI